METYYIIDPEIDDVTVAEGENVLDALKKTFGEDKDQYTEEFEVYVFPAKDARQFRLGSEGIVKVGD